MNETIKKYWVKQLEDDQVLLPIENGCWGIQYGTQENTWFAVAILWPNNVWEYLLDKKEWKFYSEQEALKRIKLAMFW
jgi:hypothetical protein